MSFHWCFHTLPCASSEQTLHLIYHSKQKQSAYCLLGKYVNIPIIQIFRTFGNVWFKEHKRMLAYFNTLSWFGYSCKRIRSITLRKLHLYVKCSFFDKTNCVRCLRIKAYVVDMNSILMSSLLDKTVVSGAWGTFESRLWLWIRYWWFHFSFFYILVL